MTRHSFVAIFWFLAFVAVLGTLMLGELNQFSRRQFQGGAFAEVMRGVHAQQLATYVSSLK
jgi:hypothetical protein